MAVPLPEVAAQGQGGLVAEDTGPMPAALAQDVGHLLVEVEVLQGEEGQLGQAHPGVDEQAQDGLVPAFLEALPDAGPQQADELVVGEDRHRLVGQLRGPHPGQGALVDLALLGHVLEELLEGGEGRPSRRRLPAPPLPLADQVGVDVLPPHPGRLGGQAPGMEEGDELADELGVLGHRGRGVVGGPQAEGELVGQVGQLAGKRPLVTHARIAHWASPGRSARRREPVVHGPTEFT